MSKYFILINKDFLTSCFWKVWPCSSRGLIFICKQQTKGKILIKIENIHNQELKKCRLVKTPLLFVKIFYLCWIIFLQIPDVYFQTMARYLAAKVQRAWRQSCKWQIKKLLFIMTLHAHCPKLINVCSMLHVTGSREKSVDVFTTNIGHSFKL